MDPKAQYLDIAYSTVGITPSNTVEHYRLAAACGFPMLKGDIRPTADGGLVMCHDDGFTFNEAGRIVRFDRTNRKQILEMTFAECLALEYDAFHDTLGYYTRVAPYEDFVRACAETGKLCFTTIRNEVIPQAAAEMMRIVRKYGMEDRLVVNSFTYKALQETRKYTSAVPVSHVQPKGLVLENSVVDAAAELGNAIVTMFSFPDEKAFDCIAVSAPAMEHARANGVTLYQAIIYQKEDRDRAIACGFMGAQIASLMAPYALLEGR